MFQATRFHFPVLALDTIRPHLYTEGIPNADWCRSVSDQLPSRTLKARNSISAMVRRRKAYSPMQRLLHCVLTGTLMGCLMPIGIRSTLKRDLPTMRG